MNAMRHFRYVKLDDAAYIPRGFRGGAAALSRRKHRDAEEAMPQAS